MTPFDVTAAILNVDNEVILPLFGPAGYVVQSTVHYKDRRNYYYYYFWEYTER